MFWHRLNKSERTKLAAFLAILFVLANLIGLQFLMRQQQRLSVDLLQLKAQKASAASWLSDQEYWTQRRDWMTQHQPKLDDLSQGNALLLEALQKSAKENNLTILEQSLGEPRKERFYQETSVQLRLTGSLESVCRWLVVVQAPENFQALRNFSLKSETDPSKVRCDVQIARWYR